MLTYYLYNVILNERERDSNYSCLFQVPQGKFATVKIEEYKLNICHAMNWKDSQNIEEENTVTKIIFHAHNLQVGLVFKKM